MKKYILIVIFAFILENVYCQESDSINKMSAEEIFYEKGEKKLAANLYSQSLYWFEKGIEQGPMYDLNYYGAAQVFFLSTETVWGVMYGELFMVLSFQDSLKTLMSKQLFDAYFDAFTLNKGQTVADFDNNFIVYSDSFERHNKFPEVFDNLMSQSAKGVRFIDIAALITIRSKFLSLINTCQRDFQNPLFAYWDKIKASGYWQAYNYWLFAYGNNNEAANWILKNKQQWNDFLLWLKKNPIKLTSTDYFSRYLME